MHDQHEICFDNYFSHLNMVLNRLLWMKKIYDYERITFYCAKRPQVEISCNWWELGESAFGVWITALKAWMRCTLFLRLFASWRGNKEEGMHLAFALFTWGSHPRKPKDQVWAAGQAARACLENAEGLWLQVEYPDLLL